MSKIFTAAWIGLFWFSICKAQDANRPTFFLQGDTTILSHYVDYGLSQSNNDPSLQGSFFFNLGPQFRLGVWGSSVGYPSSDTHVWMKGVADIRIPFTENVEWTIRYWDNHYFKSNGHDGNTIGFDLKLSSWVVIYEIHSNFLGYGVSADYAALGKTIEFSQYLKWYNQFGMVQFVNSTYGNYFDIKTLFNYQSGRLIYQLGSAFNSNAGQFSGGAVFLWAGVGVKF